MNAEPVRTTGRNDGMYAILQVLVPGDRLRRAGLLLVDGADQVHLHISNSLFTAEPDILEYWASLAEDISSLGREQGGKALLAWLEDTASNFLVIEAVRPCVVDDPAVDAERLFRKLVLHPEGEKKAGDRFAELNISRYTAEELDRARDKLPQRPAAAMRIWQSYQRRNATIEELENWLSGDPALAAQIVNLSNIVAYSRGGEIRSLKRALLQVGTETALAFLMALTIKSVFSTPELEIIWNRSVVCSKAMLNLGQRCGFDSRTDELSLLGLVMNIGKIVFANLPAYRTRLNQVRALGYPEDDCETILCGFTHAEIGSRLLQYWSFPSDLAEAVEYHHTPSRTEGREAALLFVVETWFGASDESYSIDEEWIALDRLGISPADLAGLDGDLDPVRKALCFAPSRR